MLIVLSSFLIVFIYLGLMIILVKIITGDFNLDDKYNDYFITSLSIEEFKELYKTDNNGDLYIKDKVKLKKKITEFDKRITKYILIGIVAVIIIFSITIYYK